MVDLSSLKYELNHIYYQVKASAQVDIGDDYSDIADWIEFFEKSLALTSDLKRLPILRSLWVDKQVSKAILAAMVASGISHAQAVITVFNEDLTQEEIDVILNNIQTLEEHDVIWSGTVDIWYSAVAPVYMHESFCIPVWQLAGGKLLNNKITTNVRVLTNAVAAGAAFPTASFCFPVFMEVDWTPVTKEQFEQYILEHVYAKD